MPRKHHARPPLNLRNVDLNLLVSLEALLRHQHVTRAADEIGLSQSAMSSVLGRLRRLFNDPLLSRTPRGMQKTDRGERLLVPVQQFLRQAVRVLESDIDFDPSTARHRFKIRMSDELAALVLPSLTSRIVPFVGISLEIVSMAVGETREALERDELDIAISTGMSTPSSIYQQTLKSERMVCVISAGSHLNGNRISLEEFFAHGHVKVAISPTDTRFVDRKLKAMGRERRVVATIPHWLAAAPTLRNSQLIAVMPASLSRALPKDQFRILEMPWPSEPFEWTMYWHERYHCSCANLWLRETLVSTTSEWP